MLVFCDVVFSSVMWYLVFCVDCLSKRGQLSVVVYFWWEGEHLIIIIYSFIERLSLTKFHELLTFQNLL